MKRNKVAYVIGALVIIGGVAIMYSINQYYKNSKIVVEKTDSVQANKTKLVIDTDNKDVLPKNFRTTKDKIDDEKSRNINLTGLSDLNISGSGALSQKSLAMVKEKIGDKSIIDIDLRQEDHGFINGVGISWFGKNNKYNKGISREQVISDENSNLDKISKDKHIKFGELPKGKSINTIKSIDNPESVETEEELAKGLGMSYLRITVTDHEKPTDDQVDLFIESIKNLPQDTWIHFHCRGGAGRTTTFMSMYDMMHNAKNVSFKDIMNRQKLIGGSDLLKGKNKDEDKSRVEFLNMFYKYCKDNQDGYETPWSQWTKNSGKQ
ncbi:fused DSP-PTPase phosphatase/NAD kinase-like protein [Clostridium beijerinckii]|uniref:phosphatase domain-containing putative toxin n=1 Tax=Clostridium beijerinckii TaxID=1520 RepID=UPI000479FD20|nr:protein-tyrosine-phosphatase [Clostridium beijerinckii]